MREDYFAIVMLLACVINAGATSVVMAITPTGIVMGADGKTTTVINGKLSFRTALKIVLLKHRIVVADINIERSQATNSGAILYDFPSWIREINKKTNDDLSITELMRIIKEECPVAFGDISEELRTGLTQDDARNRGLKTDLLVQYPIAGYDRGVPLATAVTLNIDWEHHSLAVPEQVSIYPEKIDSAHPYLYVFTGHSGIEHLKIADSKERKESADRVPVEYRIIEEHGELTLKQASNVIRAMLAIDAEADPTEVGFPLTVVTIPRSGRGSVRTYKKDVFALSRLPKSRSTKPERTGRQ
jgi:hypothetical protein